MPTCGKCVDLSTSLEMTCFFCGGTNSVPAYRNCEDPSTPLCFARDDRLFSAAKPRIFPGVPGCGLASPHPTAVILSAAERSTHSRAEKCPLVPSYPTPVISSAVERSWHLRALKCPLVPPEEPFGCLLTVSAWIPRLRIASLGMTNRFLRQNQRLA